MSQDPNLSIADAGMTDELASREDVIVCENVQKWFGDFQALQGVDLTVKDREVMVVLGPSGSGKSTLIRCINRLEEHQEGRIVVDGIELSNDLRNIDKIRSEVGMVFQQFNLFPHLTVLDNITLAPIWVRKKPKAEAEETARALLERVGIPEQAEKFPGQLSGGQQQRVGIARAFALSPKLLLLDEPFGMLDSLTRWQLQDVLMDVWERTRVTTVCVTHDVDEAILLADRVVMMSNGPQARVGNIMDVKLERPRTRQNLLDHADYYHYREELLDFLEAYEGGANPEPEVLEAIRLKRESRSAQRSNPEPAALEESAV